MNTTAPTRTAIVTGAASGIGLATAALLIRHDHRVIGVDRDEAGLADAARTLGPAFEPRTVDLTNTAALHELVGSLDRIDTLVNAAGILHKASIADTDETRLREVLEINLVGTFTLCRAAETALRESRGSIVNIASLVAVRGHQNFSAYAASKGAVVALSKTLAVELAPDVRVNVVCPGGVDTPMTRSLADAGPRPVSNGIARADSLIGRNSTPEEIAEIILHLARSESSSITGLVYLADGGSST